MTGTRPPPATIVRISHSELSSGAVLAGDSLLTESQTALLLSLSVRTLRNWRVLGRGPAFLKLGRSVRYRRTDIEAWKNGAVRTSTSGRGLPPSRANP
jgi:predicted DNA-binding transcriptional regulator AlpA